MGILARYCSELPIGVMDTSIRIGQSSFVEKVAITTAGPSLEGVLGPLSESRERSIRSALVATGSQLTRITEREDQRLDSHRVGLELVWYPSGQMSIGGSIPRSDGAGNAVVFGIELRPSWIYGNRSDDLTWKVEITVEVDCQHSIDHGSIHEVMTETVAAATPEAAVDALRASLDVVLRLVAEGRFERWTSMAAG